MTYLFSILVFLSLSFSVNASTQKITITGSSTVAPLISEIAKKFETKFKDVRIDVQTGGSSRGIADVRNQLSDIGMVSRGLKKTESDLMGHTIAKDGVALITHSSNPIGSLTSHQIRSIYQGQIRNWKELGGMDSPIVVVHKAEGRSTQELFLKYFQLKNRKIKASVIIGDNEQGIKTVSGQKSAIGYVSIGAAEYNASVGTPIRLLPLKGIPATVENVAKLKFPLSRKLTLVTQGKVNDLTKKFIEYAQSKEVASIVQKQYFVPTK